MSNYNQNQPQVAYPAPGAMAVEGYGQPQGANYMAPPPAGYPMSDGQGGYPGANASAPGKTQTREDGFWKGCCAALCCCCLLDACF